MRRPAAIATVLLALAVGFALIPAGAAHAGERDADLLYFWGDGCPVCADAEEWLDALAEARPDVGVARFEVWHDPAAQRFFEEVLAARGHRPQAVPTFVAGDRVWVGYTNSIETDISAELGVTVDAAGRPTGGGTLPVGGGARTLIVLGLAAAAGTGGVLLWQRRRG